MRPIAGAVLVICLVVACGSAPRTLSLTANDVRSPLRVIVSDTAGLVADGRVVQPVPDWANGSGGPVRVRNLDDRTLQVTWVGGPCPSTADLVISMDPQPAISVYPGERCQEDSGKVRVVELSLRSPVDAATITATELIARP